MFLLTSSKSNKLEITKSELINKKTIFYDIILRRRTKASLQTFKTMFLFKKKVLYALLQNLRFRNKTYFLNKHKERR